jgi:hypothetical protein
MCLGDLQQTKQNTFLLEPHLAKKTKKKKQNSETLNPQSRKKEVSSTARRQL